MDAGFPSRSGGSWEPHHCPSFSAAPGRRSIAALLNEFRHAVEARAIDSFWISRKKRRLRARPETIAQALLAVFAKAVETMALYCGNLLPVSASWT